MAFPPEADFADSGDEFAMRDQLQVLENWAYCPVCRRRVLVLEPRKALTKDGKQAVGWNCQECGGAVFRITQGQ